MSGSLSDTDASSRVHASQRRRPSMRRRGSTSSRSDGEEPPLSDRSAPPQVLSVHASDTDAKPQRRSSVPSGSEQEKARAAAKASVVRALGEEARARLASGGTDGGRPGAGPAAASAAPPSLKSSRSSRHRRSAGELGPKPARHFQRGGGGSGSGKRQPASAVLQPRHPNTASALAASLSDEAARTAKLRGGGGGGSGRREGGLATERVRRGGDENDVAGGDAGGGGGRMRRCKSISSVYGVRAQARTATKQQQEGAVREQSVGPQSGGSERVEPSVRMPTIHKRFRMR